MVAEPGGAVAEPLHSREPFNSSSANFIEYRGGKLDVSILVLSTEATARGSLVQVLQLFGCNRVSEASSAQAVKNLLAGSSSAGRIGVDLIFVDLALADSTIQVVKEETGGEDKRSAQGQSANANDVEKGLRQKIGIPIVILCERRFERQKVSALLDIGASGYITKPLRIHAIRGAVMRHCKLRDDDSEKADVEEEEDEPCTGTGDYERLEEIGRGAYGQVHLVRRKHGGKCYAEKVISIKKLDLRMQRRVLTELSLHKSFDCPFIVRSLSTWIDSESAHLLMEYVASGPLSRHVEKCREDRSEIPDQSILVWGGQLVLGLLYLHQKDIIHRDLKLENILGPDTMDRVKIADFGISRQIADSEEGGKQKDMSMMVGSRWNMAPERLGLQHHYGVASDLWALGVILYELVTLTHPFAESAGAPQRSQDSGARISRIDEEEEMEIDSSPKASSLAALTLADPITARQALPLPFGRGAVLHRVVTGGLLQKRPEDRPTAVDLFCEPTFSAAIRDYLRRYDMLANPAIMEVITMTGRDRLVNCAECYLSEDAGRVEVQGGNPQSLEESILPLAKEMQNNLRECGSPQLAVAAAKPTKVNWNSERSKNSDRSVQPSLPSAPSDRLEELTRELQAAHQEAARWRRLAESAEKTVEQDRAKVAAFKRPGMLGRWTHRFAHEGLESKFLLDISLHFTLARAILAMVVSVFFLLLLALRQRGDTSLWRDVLRRPSAALNVFFISSTCVIFASLILMLWIVLRRRCASRRGFAYSHSFLQAVLLERASALLILCYCALAIVGDPEVEAWLLGVEPVISSPLGSVALQLCINFLVGLPLILPMRWCYILVIVLVFIVASISFACLATWETQESAVLSTLPVVSLLLGVVFERRWSERGDRFQFFLRSHVPDSPGKFKTLPSAFSLQSRSQASLYLSSSSKLGSRFDLGSGEDASPRALMRRRSSNLSSVSSNIDPTTLKRNDSMASSAEDPPPAANGLQRKKSELSIASQVIEEEPAKTNMRSLFRARFSASNVSEINQDASPTRDPYNGGFRKSGTAQSLSMSSEQVFDEVCDMSPVSRVDSFRELQKQGSRESWLLDSTKVMQDTDAKVLGSGGFGTVSRGALYGAPVALKMPRSTEIESNSAALTNELRVLRHVWHPNIVRFYGSCVDPGLAGIVLVLELLEGVHLDHFVCDIMTPPPPKQRHKILVDLASALRYMHAQKPCVVHGDLKGSNICVEMWLTGPRAKLLDFGLSRLLTRKVNPLGGTVNWMAPEVIRSRLGPPGASADVFSFGRLAYMVVVGRKPLEGMRREDIIRDVKNLVVSPLEWPENLDDLALGYSCRQLAESCLTLAALMRPSMGEVYSRVQSWAMEIVDVEDYASENFDFDGPAGASLDATLRTLQSPSKQQKLWNAVSRFVTGDPIVEVHMKDLLDDVIAAAQKRHRLIMPDRLTLLPENVLSVGDADFVVAARLDETRAVVRIPAAPFDSSLSVQSTLLQEVKDLMLIKHPCIVALHGICVAQDVGMITPVVEWVEGVTLDAFVRSDELGFGRVPVATRIDLLKGIASAIWCLHEQKPPVIHGHLRDSNILVESRMSGPPRPKVLDFGWARLLTRDEVLDIGGASKKGRRRRVKEMRSLLGISATGASARAASRRALIFAAPEILCGRGPAADLLEPSADVFSLGRLCYLVVTGQEPFQNLDEKAIEEAIRRGNAPPLDWPQASLRPALEISQNSNGTAGNVDPFLVNRCQPLVERCCQTKASLRPNVDEVYRSLKSLQRSELDPHKEGESSTTGRTRSKGSPRQPRERLMDFGTPDESHILMRGTVPAQWQDVPEESFQFRTLPASESFKVKSIARKS
eukprot:TRINITY_DN24905_c0_g3_i1.p1 TRINITY_DN24905_c0_g3~~TRINITY_DN24905_c0_g3_i1.p1  ORF type:complete len:1900 (-),score=360.09 TRINITY_DN24905_c0_g3_i1:25-5565(-)